MEPIHQALARRGQGLPQAALSQQSDQGAALTGQEQTMAPTMTNSGMPINKPAMPTQPSPKAKEPTNPNDHNGLILRAMASYLSRSKEPKGNIVPTPQETTYPTQQAPVPQPPAPPMGMPPGPVMA